MLRVLREIEVSRADGLDVASACRKPGVSDATCYTWRKKFGGVGCPRLAEKKALEKESEPLSRQWSERHWRTRLKRIVADLELDKLILKETLDCLRRQA